MTNPHPSPDTLKPCPFCGTELRHSTTGRRIYWHSGSGAAKDCIMADRGISYDQVEVWNTRPESESVTVKPGSYFEAMKAASEQITVMREALEEIRSLDPMTPPKGPVSDPSYGLRAAKQIAHAALEALTRIGCSE